MRAVRSLRSPDGHTAARSARPLPQALYVLGVNEAQKKIACILGFVLYFGALLLNAWPIQRHEDLKYKVLILAWCAHLIYAYIFNGYMLARWTNDQSLSWQRVCRVIMFVTAISVYVIVFLQGLNHYE